MSGRDSNVSASEILAELAPTQKPVTATQSIAVDWAGVDFSHLPTTEKAAEKKDDLDSLDLSFLAEATAAQRVESSLLMVDQAVGALAGTAPATEAASAPATENQPAAKPNPAASNST